MKSLSYLKATTLAGCLIGLTALSGCVDQQDLYVPPTDEDTSLKPITDYFDFHTTQEVEVDFDYGKANAQVLLQFYAEDPRVMNEDSLTYQMQGTPQRQGGSAHLAPESVCLLPLLGIAHTYQSAVKWQQSQLRPQHGRLPDPQR
jgi:hypothetical protein